MKNAIVLVLILISIFFSCSKSNVENAAKPEVNIDSISVEQFDDIHILVSMKAKGSNEIKKVGICWSKSSMPTITDSSRSLSSPYSTIINKIGENDTYYFRAYIQTADKTIYSESKSISTGGLNVLIDKEYNNGRSRNIIDVKETMDGAFIALVSSSGLYSTYWPELILFNKSGDVMWSKEYPQYESQYPVNIFEIEGGFLLVTTDYTTVNFGHIFTRLDNSGNVLWEKKYGTKRNKDLMRVLDNKNNSLIITLREYDDMKNGIRENCVLTNYLIDLNGNLLSSTTYSADNGLAEGSPPRTLLMTPMISDMLLLIVGST